MIINHRSEQAFRDILNLDGSGSGLDADLVRGYDMGGFTAAMNDWSIGTGSGHTRFYHANTNVVISVAWGRVSITVPGTTSVGAAISFPITFQNTPNVVCTGSPGLTSATGTLWISAQGITTSGCDIYLGRSTSTATTIMWMAIGR